MTKALIYGEVYRDGDPIRFRIDGKHKIVDGYIELGPSEIFLVSDDLDSANTARHRYQKMGKYACAIDVGSSRGNPYLGLDLRAHFAGKVQIQLDRQRSNWFDITNSNGHDEKPIVYYTPERLSTSHASDVNRRGGIYGIKHVTYDMKGFYLYKGRVYYYGTDLINENSELKTSDNFEKVNVSSHKFEELYLTQNNTPANLNYDNSTRSERERSEHSDRSREVRDSSSCISGTERSTTGAISCGRRKARIEVKPLSYKEITCR